MRYMALACDYDGTIAQGGVVAPSTIEALERLQASGRQLILVSGRQVVHLEAVFDRLDLFSIVVAENGAVLYKPATKQLRLLAPEPDIRLVARLSEMGVAPLVVGKVVIDTMQPNEVNVIKAIGELGLENQIIFNKGAVMVLPPGINKASGLTEALKELGLSPHNVVAVGDAENDHAFLDLCECAVAVENALPALKEKANFVTKSPRGAGCEELIAELLADDLKSREDTITSRGITIGATPDGRVAQFAPYGHGLMIAGPSGSGKSTTCLGIVERIEKARYQYCLIDPEGDFSSMDKAVIVGSIDNKAEDDAVIKALRGQANVVVNLLAIPLADRPLFFADLLGRIQSLRAETGRPHWIIVDEAHHMLYPEWKASAHNIPVEWREFIALTVHPDMVAQIVRDKIDSIIAVGKNPLETLKSFDPDIQLPNVEKNRIDNERKDNQVVVWTRSQPDQVFIVTPEPGTTERRRHIRKYAEGDVREGCFYFRGPRNQLNLKAQNLSIFSQMAEGIDEETWLYHLKRRDYSDWFRRIIKDDELTTLAEKLEIDPAISGKDSREQILSAISRLYTAPANH